MHNSRIFYFRICNLCRHIGPRTTSNICRLPVVRCAQDDIKHTWRTNKNGGDSKYTARYSAYMLAQLSAPKINLGTEIEERKRKLQQTAMTEKKNEAEGHKEEVK